MAGCDPQLVLSRDTDYPDMVMDIGKMALEPRCRKKSSSDKRKQRAKLSTAVCALLNSGGGGVVRMESEDGGYSFQEHGIGLGMEQSLRECVNGTETGEHFTWVQQQSNLLLFVKTWSCGVTVQESVAMKPRCSLSTGLACCSLTSVISVSPSEAARVLRRRESRARCPEESGPRAKKALLNSHGAAGTPLSTEEHSIQGAAARLLTRDRLLAGEDLDFTETTHTEFKYFSIENILEYIRRTPPSTSAFANTEGGCLFFGVDDNSRVVGSHRTVQRGADTMGLMVVHHFCASGAGVQIKTHILSANSAGSFQGNVCALRVETFCCAVFHDNPAQEEVSLSLLLCMASRANTKLHLLYHRNIMFLRDLSLGDPHRQILKYSQSGSCH
ncbi:LOW QUALITY PROTEIN: schlafen family member 13-like [Porphyrio hochstetteri]